MNTRRQFLMTAASSAATLAHSQAPTPTPAPAPTQTPPQPPLRVVASFSILADMARVVGGEAAVVDTLVGPDADSHAFSPSPQHVRSLAAAQLVVVNGLGFEGWLQRLVAVSGFKGQLVQASAGITPRRLGAAPDPHAWQDLALAQRYVANLRDAFSAARPSQAAGFAQRAQAYQEQLSGLDTNIRQALAAVPPQRRRVVTTHDAFAYFGAAYGIEFLHARSRSSESEASAADVAALIKTLRAQRASAVFVENISNPKLLERIAAEAGVGVGGRLYSDALSAPGTAADTYLKMFALNAKTITEALNHANSKTHQKSR